MTLMELEARLTLATEGFEEGVTNARTSLSGLQTEMTTLQTETENTGTMMQTTFGHALGDLLAGLTEEIVSAAFEFARGSVEMASSMEEVQNVVDVTFGAGANQVKAWATTTAQAYGVGELAALKYAGTMGATLRGMGVGENQVYGMSTALVQLAGDMASFYNMDTATAFQKILSGITGEMEPLKSLGIVMSVANLEAQAMAMGIETAWSDMDAATQTQVRYNYLLQQTAMAQGDFANTSDSYANQMRVLEENIASLQLTLGEKLLPVMTDVVSFFNSLFGGAENGAEAIDNVGNTMVETYATIDTTTANALALVQALVAMEEAGIDNAEEQSLWNGLLEELSATLPEISSLIDQSTGSINGGTEALKTYVEQWQETQRATAIAAAMQSAQNELQAQAAKVAALQLEYKITQMTDIDVAARENEIYQKARQYLGMEDVQDKAPVGMELLDRYEQGDAYAQYLYSQLEQLGARDENVAQLESQLMAAEAQLADMNAKYVALEASVTALSEQTGKTEGEGTLESGATQSSEIADELKNVSAAAEKLAASAEAVASAPAAAVASLNGAKVEMDGQTVGQLILPFVATGLSRQFRVAAVVAP